MPLSGVIAALVTVTLWGANFVAVKFAVTDVPPLFVSGLRFSALTLLLAPYLRIAPKHLLGLVYYAVGMGVGHFCLLFVAIQYLDISTAGIVLQLGTPFVVLLAWMMLGERFGLWRLAGMSSAFGGIVVLIGFPAADVEPVWLLVLVVAAFMWSFSSIRAKQLVDIPPFTLIAWMALVVTPFAFGLSYFFETDQVAALTVAPPRFWWSLVYMTVASSIIGYGLWYYLLKRYDVTAVAPYNLLVPLVAVVCGVTIMGEQMTTVKMIGGAMILGGVSLITVRQIVLSRRARLSAMTEQPSI